MTCNTLFMAALTLLSPATLPSKPEDVVGTYVQRFGLESDTLVLTSDGGLTQTVRYDHPGDRIWKGHWKLHDGLIEAAYINSKTGTSDGTPIDWVPLAWGDRLILVTKQELIAGIVHRYFQDSVNRLVRLGKRDRDEMTLTKCAVRLVSGTSDLPLRYGKIKAPVGFEKYLLDIDLTLPPNN